MPLSQTDDGVQVACGQYFSGCLTANGKIIIWGSVSGKITNDDGLFFSKPEYVCIGFLFNDIYKKDYFYLKIDI